MATLIMMKNERSTDITTVNINIFRVACLDKKLSKLKIISSSQTLKRVHIQSFYVVRFTQNKTRLQLDQIEPRFADNTQETDWRYWEGADLSPAFLNTGQTAEVFQKVGKHLSFRQQLNSLARIGESSGLICLSTTTGILSGPVAFVESSSLISFEICPAFTLRSQLSHQ